MKQAIDVSTFYSLSDPIRKKWLAWTNKNGYGPEVKPTIGILLHFLYMHETVTIESEERESPHYGWIIGHKTYCVELIDGLWQAVKEILSKN